MNVRIDSLNVNVFIDDLNALDLDNGFLETLNRLAEVRLSPEKAKQILRNRLKAGLRTYVARLDGRVVGTATLLVEDKFIHSGGRVGHVEDVAVQQGYEKHGIGAALVRHATEEARRLGCYKVILNCYDRLVPFYERLGYHRHDVGMRCDL
jgi:glucosamine-phosphate N-acetyltransferase